MNRPTSYNLASYGDMITDSSRLVGYVPALRKAVRPGCTVLDIGSGPGFFAVLACQLGARRVFAVEPDQSIEIARSFAQHNRCADRIEFIQDISVDAGIDHLCLSLIDHKATLEQIALKVTAAYPHRFARWQDALAHITELLSRYGGGSG